MHSPYLMQPNYSTFQIHRETLSVSDFHYLHPFVFIDLQIPTHSGQIPQVAGHPKLSAKTAEINHLVSQYPRNVNFCVWRTPFPLPVLLTLQALH